MGERLTRLAVTGFRGVPTNWEIEWPGGASMVVRGDNGTGKSTIADALEWYFNGRVEFLSKEGRDRAIRHVGAPTPVKISVEVSTTGSLGGTQVMPSFGTGPWIPARVRDKFVLRGRTLSDFVEQPKAQKWKTLAEILGLQEIDSLRLDLQTVRNQLEEEARRTTEEAKRAEAAGPTTRSSSEKARTGCGSSRESGATRFGSGVCSVMLTDTLNQARFVLGLPSRQHTLLPNRGATESARRRPRPVRAHGNFRPVHRDQGRLAVDGQ